MCNHKKVFKNDIALTSFPPKFLWKCSKCGAEGTDIQKSQFTNSRLNDLTNKFLR